LIKILDEKFEEFFLVIFLICISVVLFLQIIARNVFNNSFTWSQELVRYMFVWSTFLGIPYCIKNETSLKVTQFINLLPKKYTTFLIYINKFLILIFFTIILIFSTKLTYTSYILNQKSPALNLPICIVYSSVIVSSFLSIIRILQKILNSTTEKTNY